MGDYPEGACFSAIDNSIYATMIERVRNIMISLLIQVQGAAGHG
jgi:hypothetical protein